MQNSTASESRYAVPSTFASVDESPLQLEDVLTDQKRVWLFQTPVEVKAKDLDGLEIALRGTDERVVQIGKSSYEVTRTEGTEHTGNFCLALQSKRGDRGLVVVPRVLLGSVVLTTKTEPAEPVTSFQNEKKLQDSDVRKGSARQRFTPFGSGE